MEQPRKTQKFEKPLMYENLALPLSNRSSPAFPAKFNESRWFPLKLKCNKTPWPLATLITNWSTFSNPCPTVPPPSLLTLPINGWTSITETLAILSTENGTILKASAKSIPQNAQPTAKPSPNGRPSHPTSAPSTSTPSPAVSKSTTV